MVSFSKEINDSLILARMIEEDGWVDDNTIIVCCSPDYSSITCQILNHALSNSNDGELLAQVYMEMPYPTMNQIWNTSSKEYELFDKYVVNFVSSLDKNYKYLLVDSATLRGKNFTRARQCMNARSLDSRYASVYLQDDSIFIPDYYVEKFSKTEDGGIVFQWESPLNKNWDY